MDRVPRDWKRRLEAGLEGDGGEKIEANEDGESKGDGDGDQIHVDGQSVRRLGSGRYLLLDILEVLKILVNLGSCHGEASCISFAKKKNPRIAPGADTWVPEVSKPGFLPAQVRKDPTQQPSPIQQRQQVQAAMCIDPMD
jgi:hypothetical protein